MRPQAARIHAFSKERNKHSRVYAVVNLRVDDDHEHAQASKFKIMVEFRVIVA